MLEYGDSTCMICYSYLDEGGRGGGGGWWIGKREGDESTIHFIHILTVSIDTDIMLHNSVFDN